MAKIITTPNKPYIDTIMRQTMEGRQASINKAIEFFKTPAIENHIAEVMTNAAQDGLSSAYFSTSHLREKNPGLPLIQLTEHDLVKVLKKLYPGYIIEVKRHDLPYTVNNYLLKFRW